MAHGSRKRSRRRRRGARHKLAGLGVSKGQHMNAGRASAGAALRSAKLAKRNADRGRCTVAGGQAINAAKLIGIARAEFSSTRVVGQKKSIQKLAQAERMLDAVLRNCMGGGLGAAGSRRGRPPGVPNTTRDSCPGIRKDGKLKKGFRWTKYGNCPQKIG